MAMMGPQRRGWLEKKGGGTSVFGRSNWKKRFFVLELNVLSYFDKEDDVKSLGDIPIGPDTKITIEGSEFTIATKDRNFQCKAENLAESTSWVTTLRMAKSSQGDSEVQPASSTVWQSMVYRELRG